MQRECIFYNRNRKPKCKRKYTQSSPPGVSLFSFGLIFRKIEYFKLLHRYIENISFYSINNILLILK